MAAQRAVGNPPGQLLPGRQAMSASTANYILARTLRGNRLCDGGSRVIGPGTKSRKAQVIVAGRPQAGCRMIGIRSIRLRLERYVGMNTDFLASIIGFGPDAYG